MTGRSDAKTILTIVYRLAHLDSRVDEIREGALLLDRGAGPELQGALFFRLGVRLFLCRRLVLHVLLRVSIERDRNVAHLDHGRHEVVGHMHDLVWKIRIMLIGHSLMTLNERNDGTMSLGAGTLILQA